MTILPRRGVATINRIISETAAIWGLDPQDLRGKRQHKNCTDARHMAMYLARRATGSSLPEIGMVFGSRHHTTVLAAIRKVEVLKEDDPVAAELIEHILDAVSTPAAEQKDRQAEQAERADRIAHFALRMARRALEMCSEVARQNG